jgi:hypothetical protein
MFPRPITGHFLCERNPRYGYYQIDSNSDAQAIIVIGVVICAGASPTNLGGSLKLLKISRERIPFLYPKRSRFDGAAHIEERLSPCGSGRVSVSLAN